MPGSRAHTFVLITVVVVLAAFGAGAIGPTTQPASAACPPGMSPVSPQELLEEARGVSETSAQRPGGAKYCLNDKHPEFFSEIRGLTEEWGAKMYAPWSSVDGR